MTSGVMTKFGSARYLDGTFFSSSWESVFVPLTRDEYNNFFNMVEETEIRKSRQLDFTELEDIALQVENGVKS